MATETLSRERRTIVHQTGDGGAVYESVNVRSVRDGKSGTVTEVIAAPSCATEPPADPGTTEVRPAHGAAYPRSVFRSPSPLQAANRRRH